MKTGVLGKIIPSISDQYGEDTQLDVMITMNHEVFVDGVPDAEPIGIYFDKNNQVRIVLNVHIDLRLDHSGESIRHIYTTLTVKGKAVPIKLDDNKIEHKFEFIAVEISKMAVYSMNPLKEEKNEAALFHGAGGIQLMSISKKYKGLSHQLSLSGIGDHVTVPLLQDIANCTGLRIPMDLLEINILDKSAVISIFHSAFDTPRKCKTDLLMSILRENIPFWFVEIADLVYILKDNFVIWK